jgi:hypothetical protein
MVCAGGFRAGKKKPLDREMIKNKNTDEILHQLTGLYQKDPREFEKMRTLLIEQTIAAFPARHRQRAYGLQFIIEMRLKKYKDPVVRMNKMVEIFWEQFGLFQDVLQDPGRVVAEREKKKKQAMIIPFRRGGKVC